MKEMYQSYAHQELPLSKIKILAKQYNGVDMWELMGKDEDDFPFLIWISDDDYQVMFWSKYNGMMAGLDEDPVRDYAFAHWLKNNAHPVFGSLEKANKYAEDHQWPRKERNA